MRGCRWLPGGWYLSWGEPRPHRAPTRCPGGPPAQMAIAVVLGCSLARRAWGSPTCSEAAAGLWREGGVALHPLPNHGHGQRLRAPAPCRHGDGRVGLAAPRRPARGGPARPAGWRQPSVRTLPQAHKSGECCRVPSLCMLCWRLGAVSSNREMPSIHLAALQLLPRHAAGAAA